MGAVKKVTEDVEVKVDFDFEDSKPETFKFKLPAHYAGKRVYGEIRANEEGYYTFHGTREEVAPIGRILTRFYGATLVK